MQINLTAPINSLGYGVVSQNAVLSLSDLGHDVSLFIMGHGEQPSSQAASAAIAKCLKSAESYNRLAPSLKIWHQFDLAHHVGKGIHAAVPYFEVDRLRPFEVTQLNAQDVVFASSNWMEDVLRENGVKTQIRIANPGVDGKVFRPILGSASKATTFLCVGKWEVRKGHDVVVECFNKAFTASDNVQLVMLTANPLIEQERTNQWHTHYKSSPLASKIRIIPNRLPTQQDVAKVMAEADCGVFISRAEGWNLDLAEMMAMGKHVIATNFSAHTEFVTRQNAHLVHIDHLEDAFDGKWFHGFGQWAALEQNQIDQVVEHMRSIHRAKTLGILGTNQEAVHNMSHFTWRAFAEAIAAGLSS